MQRTWNPLLGGLVLLCGLVVALSDRSAASAPASVDDDRPRVEARKHKNYVETIPGSEVRFEMVAIPGGTFHIGSPRSEKGRSLDEGPRHAVTIRPFWMGKCEVTWDEFDLYRKNPPQEEANKGADAVTRPTLPYADETFGYGREGRPVISVSHHMAMEYCRWLSSKTGKQYRLPTEAEWEWACRAGTTTAYFFGDDPKQLGEYAWFADNSDEEPHPVGLKKPNPWGLHDILGNVGEWCLDHYARDTYTRLPTDRPALSPVQLPTTKIYPHVVRGGSWDDKAPRLRCAARLASNPRWNRLDPDRPQSIWWLTSAEFVGFRVVRAVEEQDNLKGIRSKVTKESD